MQLLVNSWLRRCGRNFTLLYIIDVHSMINSMRCIRLMNLIKTIAESRHHRLSPAVWQSWKYIWVKKVNWETEKIKKKGRGGKQLSSDFDSRDEKFLKNSDLLRFRRLRPDGERLMEHVGRDVGRGKLSFPPPFPSFLSLHACIRMWTRKKREMRNTAIIRRERTARTGPDGIQFKLNRIYLRITVSLPLFSIQCEPLSPFSPLASELFPFPIRDVTIHVFFSLRPSPPLFFIRSRSLISFG